MRTRDVKGYQPARRLAAFVAFLRLTAGKELALAGFGTLDHLLTRTASWFPLSGGTSLASWLIRSVIKNIYIYKYVAACFEKSMFIGKGNPSMLQGFCIFSKCFTTGLIQTCSVKNNESRSVSNTLGPPINKN